MEWDESFKNRADCSGRSVAGVHDAAYDETFDVAALSGEDKAVFDVVKSVDVKDFTVNA